MSQRCIFWLSFQMTSYPHITSNPATPSNFFFIQDTKTLNAHMRPLLQKPPAFIALDTEFMRQTTYWPQPCLLQMATEKAFYIVDLQASPLNFATLKELLVNPTSTKVLHAAEQDLELLSRLFKKELSPVFDTQVATMLLAPSYMPSYKEAVLLFCNKELSKAYQRFDWRKRPLPDKVLNYALDDVRYLVSLYQICIQKLRSQKRLAWMHEEMARMALTKEPLLWKKVVGWKKVVRTPQDMTALQKLALWREEAAQKADLPRQHVLSNEVILRVLKQLKSSSVDVSKIERALKGLQLKDLQKKCQTLCAISTWPESRCDPLPAARPLEAPDKERSVQLKQYFEKVAAKEGLPCSFLVVQKEIEALVRGKTPKRFQKGWRQAFLPKNVATKDKSALTSQQALCR